MAIIVASVLSDPVLTSADQRLSGSCMFSEIGRLKIYGVMYKREWSAVARVHSSSETAHGGEKNSIASSYTSTE